MNCPDCSQSVEASASFCGNCGRQLKVVQQSAAIPEYALAVVAHDSSETRALLSLLFGITGIVGGLFMALIGLGLGIAGLIMGTMAASTTKRRLRSAGLLASSLAVLVGMGVWVYAIHETQNTQAQITSVPADPTAEAASSVSTPCYSVGFIEQFNVSNTKPSCDAHFFNGKSLASSTNAYKIYANKSTAKTEAAFLAVAKDAVHKDVETSLPGFKIDKEQATTFAGSPAYVVNASKEGGDLSVVEAAVMHPVSSGENVFVLVHALNAPTVDLSTLEAQWQWK